MPGFNRKPQQPATLGERAASVGNFSEIRPPRCASWAAVAVARESLHLSRYLERVAAMPLLRMVADQSLERLSLAPGQRALEVGCGSGVFLPRLAEAVGPAGKVMGIDHAVTFVAQALGNR